MSKPSSPESPGSSLKEIAIAAFAATLLASFANSAWLMFADHGGRAVQTGFYFFLPAITDQFGYPLRHLPGQDFFIAYRDLTDIDQLLRFFPAAAAANLLLNSILLVPGCAAVGWISARSGGTRRWGALTQNAPEITALFCLTPAVLLPIDGAFSMVEFWPGASRTIACGVTAVLIGSLILAAMSRMPVALLLVRVCRGTAWVLTPVLLIGLAWSTTALNATDRRPLPPAGSPNVLLISIDSLRADHLGTYGYHLATSPNIDQLAREGARFETVASSTSWTLPSHMTLMTGLDPMHHGVSEHTKLAHTIRTLAEAFHQAGYVTGGIVSATYLDGKWGYTRGFDSYDDYSMKKGHRGAELSEITSPALFSGATKWLGNWSGTEGRRPFFLFLHMWDVHYDYNPPAPYDAMFDPGYEGSITSRAFISNPEIHADMDARELDHIIALYDGEIRYTDEYVGRLLGLLLDLGISDDTVVAVTADHGDEFFEHGWKGHHRTLYDEVLLVPLVVRYPRKVPAGVVVEEPVRLMDVGPTLLALAGVEDREFASLPGDDLYRATSLKPLIDGESMVVGPAFADLHTGKVGAVRSRDAKLILDRENGVEFYDLAADPRESIHESSLPAEADVMADLLSEWYLKREGPMTGDPVHLDSHTKDLLRSLGYIE